MKTFLLGLFLITSSQDYKVENKGIFSLQGLFKETLKMPFSFSLLTI